MDRDNYNQNEVDFGNFNGTYLSHLVEFWQRGHLMEPDGRFSPIVCASIHDEMPTHCGDAPTDPTRQIWQPFQGPIDKLPRNRADVYKVFGDPSNGGKVNRRWKKENIQTFRKAHALPGVDPRRHVKLHKLAEPYFREALRRARIVSDYEIRRFGDFVYRLMRSKSRLSYHSFGIAMDINPGDNRAIRYGSVAMAPEPWSEDWYNIWPNGMDKAFVDAIKSVGFAWGGDWRTFKDPMHFELVL